MKLLCDAFITMVLVGLVLLFVPISASMAQDGLEEFVIKATATDGGAIEPPGDVYVVAGESQTFVMFPDKGFFLRNVLVDDKPMGPINPYTFEDAQFDHTMHAIFERDELEEFVIKVTAVGGGYIKPSGDVIVVGGDDQAFEMISEPGPLLDVIVDGKSVGPMETYTFKDTQSDHTIHAIFEFVTDFVIMATASPGGSISPSGEVRVLPGADQTFGMLPDPGCILLNVFVDGKPVGPEDIYTFSRVGQDHSIYALFLLPATIDGAVPVGCG